MKILITGATGMVGKELGKKLTSDGHELFVLTRSPQKSGLQCPFPHYAFSWSELSTEPKLRDVEHIIHLAGTNINEKRWSQKFKDEIRESRVHTTQQLVEWANQHCQKLESFISTSAVGIYGDTGNNQSIDETAPLSYNFLGKVCQDWEEPLQRLERGRSVVFRVGIVFSEKGGALEKMTAPIQAGIGGTLGSGKQYMSWVDIDDLVALYCFALNHPIKGVFNATAPEPATNKVISETIAQQLNTKLLAPVPYFALRLIMGEVAPHLVESQRINSKKIEHAGFQFQYPQVQDSLRKRVPLLERLQKRFIFEQWVPQKNNDIFPFFANAHNLESITPAQLNFNILNVSTPEVQEGTIINYKLKIDGIPIRWKTSIKQWDPPHCFVDNQESGPYKKWHHTHRFDELADGTLMTDQVDIEIPLGPIGYLASQWKVLRDVKMIFEYRKKIIAEKFGSSQK